MERDMASDEKAVIIGDLAKIYKISKRALRLYHEKGLLVPSYVNEDTGYRYYSPTQFARLDMILQMKNAGFSLEKIKQMLDTQNLSLFEAILGEQIDKLNDKITECEVYKEALTRQLNSYQFIRNPPVLESIFMEYIPRRAAFIYDIENYDLEQVYTDNAPWQNALDRVKELFVEKNVPLALFQQVGGIVSKDALLHNKFICSGAFIQINENHQYDLPLSSVEPGIYVCMYHKYAAMDNAAESCGIRRLLDHISNSNGEYEIIGPYIAQVVAETSIFDHNSNDIIVKQQIPIKVTLS